MKIYCTVGHPCFTPTQLETLKQFGEVTIIEKLGIPEEEYLNIVSDAEIIIAAPEGIPKITANIIKSSSKLKFLTMLTVGYNWIDIDAAKRANLPISNVKGANSESVAEHIWGMILDLSKRITEFDRDARNISAFEFSKYKGHEVYGKTLGLIGTGDIGSKVARIAKGFDIKILGINKSRKEVEGIEMVDINTLLTQSDIVSISVPLDDTTLNLISKPQINLMKEGAILINCAREEIVDKSAVIEAINSKKLSGYGVDTKILVPLTKDDEYFKYPNILVNIHNAFNTVESDENCYGMAIENIKKFLSGNPQNLI